MPYFQSFQTRTRAKTHPYLSEYLQNMFFFYFPTLKMGGGPYFTHRSENCKIPPKMPGSGKKIAILPPNIAHPYPLAAPYHVSWKHSPSFCSFSSYTVTFSGEQSLTLVISPLNSSPSVPTFSKTVLFDPSPPQKVHPVMGVEVQCSVSETRQEQAKQPPNPNRQR